MRTFESIEELLQAKEGESYQFKEWEASDNFAEAKKICCALSNGGGGKFVMGISDKRPREVVDSLAFPQPERTRKDLIDKLHGAIDFQLYDHQGKRVLVFDVASRPIGLPVHADGISWWYEGDSLVPTFNERVIREVLLNAVDHMNYQLSGSTAEGAPTGIAGSIKKSVASSFKRTENRRTYRLCW